MEFIHLLLSNLIGQNVQAMVQIQTDYCNPAAHAQRVNKDDRHAFENMPN